MTIGTDEVTTIVTDLVGALRGEMEDRFDLHEQRAATVNKITNDKVDTLAEQVKGLREEISGLSGEIRGLAGRVAPLETEGEIDRRVREREGKGVIVVAPTVPAPTSAPTNTGIAWLFPGWAPNQVLIALAIVAALLAGVTGATVEWSSIGHIPTIFGEAP